MGLSLIRLRPTTQNSGSGTPSQVRRSPTMWVSTPSITAHGSQTGDAVCASSSHAPPHDSSRLPITVFSARPGMTKCSARSASPIDTARSSRLDQNQSAARLARKPNRIGARIASCVPHRCPRAIVPTTPEGMSETGPHIREMVEPRWSRSGNMANPPAAATQAAWPTAPCTGAQGSVTAPAARPESACE
jgi:hypothetical protein